MYQKLIKELEDRAYLGNYISCIGLMGSYAFNEQTEESDVDFGVVTHFLNPILSRKVEAIFKKHEPKASVLFFGPSIFQRPNSMFFELISAHQYLFGTIDYHDFCVPLWEAFRVMTNRNSHYILERTDHTREKAILGCVEALLVIRKEYVASKRAKLDRAKSLWIAPYLDSKDDFEIVSCINRTWEEVVEAWGGMKELLKTTAPFPTTIYTRLKAFSFREPYVKEIFLNIGYFKEGCIDEKKREKLLRYWRIDIGFWHTAPDAIQEK